MNFKKGDIVEHPSDGGMKIVVKLTSDARYSEYIRPWGKMSSEKSWWASGRHIEGPYRGIFVSTFHLENCSLINTFGLKRSIKKLEL